MSVTITERQMTPKQRQALDKLGDDHPDARVVGWDTSCNGPLVAVGDPGEWFAISPRGKYIDRKD